MPSVHHLEEISTHLKRVPFLAALTAEQRTFLAERAQIRRYPPGARLVLEGTYGDTLFIIHEGEVEVFVRRHGQKVMLGRRTTGNFFGEMGLLEIGLPRTATVQTLTSCTMIEVKKPAFDALLEENAAVASAVLREVSRRLRSAAGRMVEGLLSANEELVQANQRIEENYDATLAALSSALDLRDTETEGHSRRVTEYTYSLAKAMGLSEEQLRVLHRGALLHDIGKIGVPDAILRKPGPLTPDEWRLMANHPLWGAEILRGIGFLEDSILVVRYHHEWWNGSGYPEGLSGETIPIFARIFAVVDIFDALTSARPYRRASSARQALEILRAEAGTHLDPQIFATFEEIFTAIIEPLWRTFQRHPQSLSSLPLSRYPLRKIP